MIENSFEWYIGLFIFYIILINYKTFMDQILIFGAQLNSKRNCPLFYHFTLQILGMD